MRNLLRAALAALAVAGGAGAAYRLCVLPYRCDQELQTLMRRTYRAADLVGSPEGAILARRNLERLAAVRGACTHDVTWMMLTAANERFLDQLQQAVDHYTEALRFHQRPEIYYNRGMTLLSMGRVDEAITDLAVAARFTPQILDLLDPETRRRVGTAAGLP
ncbi:MAG: hypothetical protein AABO58_09600 [Acidobacteriota bacterium]